MEIFHNKNPWHMLLISIGTLFNIYVQPGVYCMMMSFIYMILYEVLNTMHDQTIEYNIKKYIYSIIFVFSYKMTMNVGLVNAIASTGFILLCCYYSPIFIIPLF